MEQVQSKTSIRDFFLYLFATGALYFSAISIISLLWQYINHFFPDALTYYPDGLSSSMRWAVASLIVIFPVYVFVMRFLSKDLDAFPEKKDLSIRKAMIYLTLFIAAITIVVDLVMLVNNFLGGEFTVRFLLKALSVLFVTGAVFGYYLFNLKRVPGTQAKARSMIVWGSLAFVLIVIAGAFSIVGSPTTNRLRNLDNQRVSDLQTIQWQVVNYWQQKQKLPVDLSALNDPISGFKAPVDPETGAAYTLKSVGSLGFQLCANFALENIAPGTNSSVKPYSEPYGYVSENWQHAAGNVCFDRTIDPDLYPPVKR